MEKTDKRYQAYIDILREELIPAMGCTEPIAVAYAAAAARNTLGELPDKVLVEASGSMIKNVKSVIVPNTDNMKGLEAAAAAGIVAGKQEKKLEVIADVTPEQTKAIRAYLDQTDIKVRHVENGVTFDIILTVWKGEHSAQVRIAVFHTNIVHVEKDGEVLVDIPVHGDNEETLTDRSLLDMEHIWDFANTVDVEDVRSILEPQIRCNMAIAEEGLRGNYGANIGSVLLDMEGNDVRVRAKAYAAAGSDARMNGCEQPVVINSGSGNQGITASVPVIVYAQELGVSDGKLLRSRAAMSKAELVIAVVDGSGEISDEDLEVIAQAEAAPKGIVVLSKRDIAEPGAEIATALPVVSLSSVTGEGMDELERVIAEQFPLPEVPAGEILTNVRQADAVKRAIEYMRSALDAMRAGMTPDIVLTETEGAMSALGELSGRTVREDVTNRIFQRFCVGK